MIGQRDLTSKIFSQIERGKFPRFSIIIGDVGSGRRTLVNEIAERLKAAVCTVDIKADIIRNAIETAYKIEDVTMLYLIADADEMSQAAANAILKVTEEPPNNAYFVLTCKSIDNLLATLKSRGVTYMMEPYSYEDKCDYFDTRSSDIDNEEFITSIASNLGEVSSLLSLDVKAFRDYVNLVVDNIAEVPGSNAFKISDKINFKDDKDKFDIKLFWSAFSSICVDRMLDNNEPLRYAKAVAVTGDAIQQLSIRGINKQMLFDAWVLDIREVWL